MPSRQARSTKQLSNIDPHFLPAGVVAGEAFVVDLGTSATMVKSFRESMIVPSGAITSWLLVACVARRRPSLLRNARHATSTSSTHRPMIVKLRFISK